MVRLRLDTRSDDVLGASIRKDLRALGALESEDADRRQVTLRLKGSRKLPGLTPDSAPDAVVEWFVRQMKAIAAILDARLGRG
jgi:hypothetical protein